ncbi:membrane bound O-acyl transferase family-domain-containing protein [Mycena floridula]|nr:membrane bound O-acyl transferase family-domain-containing protein [Mycena floridula]
MLRGPGIDTRTRFFENKRQVPPTDPRILLPLLCYFTTAFLAQTKRRFTTFAFLPCSLYAVLWATISVDLLAGMSYSQRPRFVYLNQAVVVVFLGLAMRCTAWTFSKEIPFKRTQSSGKFRDTIHLGFSLRGIDWNCSKGLYIIPETRLTSSRTSFLLSTLASALAHVFVLDFFHDLVERLSPITVDGSIFNPSLPIIDRYCLAASVSFAAGMVVYSGIHAGYDIITIIAVFILQQPPRQYPLLFDKPWLATSVTEFWSRRWHQVFRDSFVGLGYAPGSALFGRPGGVIGAFVVSGILHYIALWGMGNGTELQVIGSFIMMGVGIVLEGAWKQSTGHRIGGLFGWVWAVIWIISWSTLLVDAWAKKGLINSSLLPLRPGKWLVEQLILLSS